MQEFSLIETFFTPLAGKEGLGLLDDAACLTPPPGYDLIISKDMLVAGTHFIGDEPANTIGHKALAVNLSDLAAKGATPYCYFLGLALPEVNPIWLQSFASGLQKMQENQSVSLAGGDTTRVNGPAVISITACGYVPAGKMIRRNGAAVGDLVCVSGELGDGAFGLVVAQGKLPPMQSLLDAYQCPQPRTDIGPRLLGLASAAADISDGLIADLGHICHASGVGAVIHQKSLPISENVRQICEQNTKLESCIWSGGDDYELVFTVPPEKIPAVQEKTGPAAFSVIGEIIEGQGISLLDAGGQDVPVSSAGYTHF